MKFLKNKSENQQTEFVFNDEDIALLAVMCASCRPLVVKNRFFAHSYAYYVPYYEKNLDLAKDLFKKNGIETRVHFSRIVNAGGQNVLRVDYKRCKNPEMIESFFKKIRAKKHAIFYGNARDEEKILEQQVANLMNARTK